MKGALGGDVILNLIEAGSARIEGEKAASAVREKELQTKKKKREEFEEKENPVEAVWSGGISRKKR